MGDFKNYRQQNNGSAADGGSGQRSGKNGGGTDIKQAMELAATLAKTFAGKSEGQILTTIISQAEQGKRDGTLTDADLDAFYAALSPFLDSFKRKKLQQVIAKLKRI